MKFNELQFEQHKGFKSPHVRIAKMYFPNGYGVSVLSGAMFRSNGLPVTDANATFEVAILYKNKMANDTPIVINGVSVSTTDVLNHLSADAVEQVMKQVAEYATR